MMRIRRGRRAFLHDAVANTSSGGGALSNAARTGAGRRVHRGRRAFPFHTAIDGGGPGRPLFDKTDRNRLRRARQLYSRDLNPSSSVPSPSRDVRSSAATANGERAVAVQLNGEFAGSPDATRRLAIQSIMSRLDTSAFDRNKWTCPIACSGSKTEVNYARGNVFVGCEKQKKKKIQQPPGAGGSTPAGSREIRFKRESKFKKKK